MLNPLPHLFDVGTYNLDSRTPGGSGIMAIDPVCGMTVDESTAISAEKDGKRFYFCCSHCRQKFLGDSPMLQLGMMKHEMPAPKKVIKAKYYCPMCDGVTSDKPGTCPKCGMALEPTNPQADNEDDSELRDMTKRLVVALLLSVPVLLLSMLPMVGLPVDRWLGHSLHLWLQLSLSTPVVLWCGWPFFVRGVRSVRTLHLNMFTLIAVGTGAAYLYSLVAVLVPTLIPEDFRHHGTVPVYFEAAAVIITLVLLGQVLELRARRRTGSAIRELLSLAPPTARVFSDGQEREVPLEEVREGNLLRVRRT